MQKKIKRRHVDHSEVVSHHLHPLLQRVYHHRGIRSLAELDHGLEKLLPFKDLLGIEQAVACLVDALEQQKRILIVGDFDADGATSSALAVRALKSFGAQHVNFLVPNRFAFGYGLTSELVHVAKKSFDPDVIVTVDNGIANHAGVLTAKELGMQVVITDHHLASDTLPLADAIVNPNQKNDLFPGKNTAGVGVIFYVMLALRRKLMDEGWFEKYQISEPNMSKLLDLVALGTIADVVPLDHNNRILVQQGLRRIRASQCIPGITALLEMANRQQSRIVASDLGFTVAPRLNAAGRLEDMSLGIECLLTDDIIQARDMAKELDALNSERRIIEQDMQEQAFSVLKSLMPGDEKLNGICLFDEDWHQGVIGILASRIKDRMHRPVIAFAVANEHEIKGSARSIPGLHIRDVLADISTQYPDLISKFGGHAMAAGLTVPRAQFESFAKAFTEAVFAKMNDEMLNNSLLSDGELHSQDLTLEVAEILREGGPWGQSFPEPLFDGEFELLDQRVVGGKHLKMTLVKDEKTLDAIAFNIDINQWPNYRCNHVKIAYRVDVNEFRGKKNIQLIVEQLESV
jgi:single-stranded-DNA-specific exonuclease